MKNTINFTIKALDNLALPKEGQLYIFDEQVQGLFIRVTHLGVKADINEPPPLPFKVCINMREIVY